MDAIFGFALQNYTKKMIYANILLNFAKNTEKFAYMQKL